MALDNFIPEVWSAKLLQNLHKAQKFAQAGVINRDYEGEISAYGDTVRINNIGAVSVFDYVKNVAMNAPETLTDAQRTLLIDQAKAFNFQIDDIDKAQQNPKVMGEAMRESAYGLADTLDTFLAGKYGDADANNLVGSTGTPIALTSSNAYDQLVALRTKLQKANVPTDSRWVIVPPEFTQLILLDNRFINAQASADNGEALRNGAVGRAAGFDVIESNNVGVVTGTKYKIMAGHPMAWSLAEQIESVEGYRPQLSFADAVKGLHLYGAKVVRPAALACLTATF